MTDQGYDRRVAVSTLQSLEGLRVLVVEDEAMIAMMIEDMLTDFGAVVVGPAGSVAQALAALEAERIDTALLDVNLGGEKSFAVADALVERGVRFIFTTGYGDGAALDLYPGSRTLQKPFLSTDLENALRGSSAPA